MKLISLTKIAIIILFVGSQSISIAQDYSDVLLHTSQSQNLENIKSIDAKYFADKVFLHILVNGITENKTLIIERSIDGTNFELIGTIACIGCQTKADIAYYFTDDTPLASNAYYRVVNYTDYNQPYYSESVIVSSGYKTLADASGSTISGYTKK
jgi:hypothetical protein